MTTFVRIADERDSSSIRRNALRLPKRGWKQYEGGCSYCQRGRIKSRKIQDSYRRRDWVSLVAGRPGLSLLDAGIDSPLGSR